MTTTNSRSKLSLFLWLAVALGLPLSWSNADPPIPNPILYVTQVPPTATSGTVVSIAGTHLASTEAAPRGGDLMIRYPDGSIRNLTRLAGFGDTDQIQGAASIAVRDPHVHWSGNHALFSMVVGAPESAGPAGPYYWQIYQVSGLGPNDTPTIQQIQGQPTNFNNIQPAYTSDGNIVFASDRTLDGTKNIYPSRDEQGAEEAVTGLWHLEGTEGTLQLLDHSPSGSFEPFVDSYGRIVFSRWDHLQRDEFATEVTAYDYESVEPGAISTTLWSDVFPEPIDDTGAIVGHKFDQFLPWTINQDGTGLLTMNHLGRHDLGTSFDRSRTDSNLEDFTAPVVNTSNVGSPTRAGSYLQISESGTVQGKYIATDAISNAVSAGRLVTFTSPAGSNGDLVIPTIASSSGLARDASYLSNGTILGSFVSGPVVTGSYGGATPGPIPSDFIPPDPFHIRVSSNTDGTRIDIGTPLTPNTGIIVTNFINGSAETYSGPLWQLQPVEVVPRTAPVAGTEPLDPVEHSVFKDLRVSVNRFKIWLSENKMALLASRNVTARDRNDKQQPYNLFVPGGVASIADPGPAYPITNVQFFQGDYVRGYAGPGGQPDPSLGRRITARLLHSNPEEIPQTSVPSSTPIHSDGSMAIIVPAERALTWHLTDDEGNSVVKERYWLNFKAGEIRTCSNCHGNNTADQLGRPPVTNQPSALAALLTDWLARHPEANAKVTPYEFWAETAITPDAPANGDNDLDRLTNLEEFTYGTNPLVNDVGAPSAPAIPLRSELVDLNGTDHARLTFTRRTGEDLRITVESSANLRDWTSVAVIEDDTIQTPNALVAVATSASAAQTNAGIQQVDVTATAPADEETLHYRLRIESL